VHPEDVVAKAIHQQVPVLGGYLASWNDEKIVPLGQVIDLSVVPETVMVGDTYPVQPDSFGLLY
jgi:hypothetical protein